MNSEAGRFSRIVDSRWFLRSTAVFVFLFAALRGTAAWPLANYGMSVWAFILIDLVTAYPYVYCINYVARGIRSKPWWMLMLNGFGISASFAAPYIYLYWSAGEAMPTWVIVVIAWLIAVLALVGPVRTVTTAVLQRSSKNGHWHRATIDGAQETSLG